MNHIRHRLPRADLARSLTYNDTQGVDMPETGGRGAPKATGTALRDHSPGAHGFPERSIVMTWAYVLGHFLSYSKAPA